MHRQAYYEYKWRLRLNTRKDYLVHAKTNLRGARGDWLLAERVDELFYLSRQLYPSVGTTARGVAAEEGIHPVEARMWYEAFGLMLRLNDRNIEWWESLNAGEKDDVWKEYKAAGFEPTAFLRSFRPELYREESPARGNPDTVQGRAAR
jgi:hypothetical protein